MSAPAGPCEWCGGPQWWTVILGEVAVACKLGCLPLLLEGLDPLPDSEKSEQSPKLRHIGTLLEGGGSRPYEGGDAKTSAVQDEDGLPW